MSELEEISIISVGDDVECEEIPDEAKKEIETCYQFASLTPKPVFAKISKVTDLPSH